MKRSTASALGHAIFQVISVDGEERPLLYGLRAPGLNNPVFDVDSEDLICGKVTETSDEVVQVSAGAEIGARYQHVLGGAMPGDDTDNPIAESHKGPITAWLASVKDAASTSASGLQWFKIFEYGLNQDTGHWATDKMMQNDGWVNFEIPECITDGDYLLRVEVLALHSAGDIPNAEGPQFFTSCANVRVTGGSGDLSVDDVETVSIPGVYSLDDEALNTSIYGVEGLADNRGEPYTPAGPRAIEC